MKFQRMIMEVESPEQIGYDLVHVNLAESSMRDRTLAELGMPLEFLANQVLCYGDHRGSPHLREQIASDARGDLNADNVLVTVGAAGALFLVATALLEPGDHLIVARPNYASNIETPRAIGAEIVFLDLCFDDGYKVDLDRVRALVTPETKLISLTTPHNPTGTVIPADDLLAIVELTERAGCWLLLDETYRELADKVSAPASVVSDRVISVSSLSKTYGVPGIRVGWITCRNAELMTTLLAAQEQAALALSILDIAVAEFVMARRDQLLPAIRRVVQSQRDIVASWVDREPAVEWVRPGGRSRLLPRFADPQINARAIYDRAQAEGVFLGPGWWFEQEDRSMRIGYGYPTADELQLGLATISAAVQSVER